jgi:hypothetical protein
MKWTIILNFELPEYLRYKRHILLTSTDNILVQGFHGKKHIRVGDYEV